jgi:hypothetical protein
LDSPVTQMTRPAKGPSARAAPAAAAPAPAAAPCEAAEEEETDAADEGLCCIPGITSRAHPLLATTSTPLRLRDIPAAAAASASEGGGTRATHVGRNY